MNQTSKPRIRSTVSMTFNREIEAQDLQGFLADVPAEATVRVDVERGDPRDPREAGHFSITITATWNGAAK
ncbi:hypothetical protein PBI_BRIDGETTE_64 [Arthrobacter phage Bridgette]|uniref:Uncharacterized protein n=1 Tax=Arthrobacter phage Bridgette TaxID=2419949 RepID=A0A3G2KEH5_9CAUD|nr:hypothetical protein HOU46_gp64 [Arthrobacter phage Bridgette]AYN57330.1 hypothetical protein PBI_BRIDGETTE_64 [Arthrobacter phage Bridgette]